MLGDCKTPRFDYFILYPKIMDNKSLGEQTSIMYKRYPSLVVWHRGIKSNIYRFFSAFEFRRATFLSLKYRNRQR